MNIIAFLSMPFCICLIPLNQHAILLSFKNKVNLKVTGSRGRDDSHKKPLECMKHFEVKPNTQKIKCVIIELYPHTELL